MNDVHQSKIFISKRVFKCHHQLKDVDIPIINKLPAS